MHYRFRGNPNTNDASRLLATNQHRAKHGLPPLTLAEFTGEAPGCAPGKALLVAAPFLPPPPKPQRKLF